MAKTLAEVKSAYLDKAKKRSSGAYAVKDPETGAVAACSTAPFPHSFDGGKTWVQAQLLDEPLYRSKGGGFYFEADLPEQDDKQVQAFYEQDMRSERNARIGDTDSYVQLSDVTVQKAARSKRSALTDEEKAEVLAYRTALRDLPDTEGWPFVDFPEAPSCIAVEVQEKIATREAMRASYES